MKDQGNGLRWKGIQLTIHLCWVSVLTHCSEEIGTHIMRKSFGYHHYQQYKDVALLQTIYNHSSPSITLKYIGINQDNIDLGYRNFSI